MRTISKGYFLDKWFKIGDLYLSEMRNIFLRNGLTRMELELLPKSERLLWYSLKKKNDRVMKNICEIIKQK